VSRASTYLDAVPPRELIGDFIREHGEKTTYNEPQTLGRIVPQWLIPKIRAPNFLWDMNEKNHRASPE
jgi:hypothetical protein